MIKIKTVIIRYIKVFSALFFVYILFGVNNSNDIKEYCREHYKDTLNKTALIIIKGKKVNDSTLLFCIPQTKEEAFIFFDLDYSKDKRYNQVYRQLNELWLNKCIEKQKNFIVNYFEFSKFVDGYFAEDYFINIKKIYKNVGDEICPNLLNCSQNKIKRLLIFLKENDMCN